MKVIECLREQRPIIIVDLDGTLFNNQQRRHLIPKENFRDPHSWADFNKACLGDMPIVQNITTVKTLIDAGFLAVYLTSRGNGARPETETQLRSVGLVPFPLIMRPMDEHRKPHEWKVAVIEDVEKYYGYKVTAAMDDDPGVCNAMRQRGIAVAQVRSECASVTVNY